MDGNNNKNMNMNPTEPLMEQSVPTRTAPIGSKSHKGRKAFVWILVIIMLAAGIAGGYFYGQYQKNQEVEKAKQDAQAAAQAEIAKIHQEHAKEKAAPAKTETASTCNADELSLAFAATDAAVGTDSYDITFTNIGDRTCTLVGYPGVSLVNDNGNMIGSPAERTTNVSETETTLAPEGKVKAILYATSSDMVSEGQCTEGATKIRVYPPNDTGYLSIPTVETLTNWCPGFEISPVMNV